MSRVLRGLKHIRQESEKYRFSLRVEAVKINHSKAEKTFATVEWIRGPKRCRGREVVVLSPGANSLEFAAGHEFVLIATLFRKKGAGEPEKGDKPAPANASRLRKFALRRNSTAAASTGEEETDARAGDCLFLPKESKLQLVEVQESGRRSFRALTGRARLNSFAGASGSGLSPSTPEADAATASGSLSGASRPSPPLNLRAAPIASAVLAERRIDLAQFVNARVAKGNETGVAEVIQERLTLPLDRCGDPEASITFVLSFTHLGSAGEGDDDAVSLHSGLVSLASDETFFRQSVAAPAGFSSAVSGPAAPVLAVRHPQGASSSALPPTREALERPAATAGGHKKPDALAAPSAAEPKKTEDADARCAAEPAVRPLGAAPVKDLLQARERCLNLQRTNEAGVSASAKASGGRRYSCRHAEVGLLAGLSLRRELDRDWIAAWCVCLSLFQPTPSPSSEASTSGSTPPLADFVAPSPLPVSHGTRGGTKETSLATLRHSGGLGATTAVAEAETGKVLQLLKRVAELERKNEEKQRLLMKAQQALDAKESAERDDYENKIRNLFSQIEDLHTSLANAQEEQLSMAQQLEEERARRKAGEGDGAPGAGRDESVSSASYSKLRDELSALRAKMQQADRAHKDIQAQHLLQQKQQHERIEELQVSLHRQQDEAHAERASLQALLRQHQTAEEMKEAELQRQAKALQTLEAESAALCRQCEAAQQSLAQISARLGEEKDAREKAERELTGLRNKLGEEHHDDPLMQQLLTLQQEVSELTATRDELRRRKERDERAHLQHIHQLQEQLRQVREQQQERIHILEQEKVTLRMQVLALEHEISLLPSGESGSSSEGDSAFLAPSSPSAAAFGVAGGGGAGQDAEAARGRRAAEKRAASLIEELETDLVKTKIELALAEQRRAEDLDICKHKIASLKDTILNYAAVVSDLEVQVADLKLQTKHRDFFFASGSSVGARRLKPIRSLRSLFRASRAQGSRSSPECEAAQPGPCLSLTSGASSPPRGEPDEGGGGERRPENEGENRNAPPLVCAAAAVRSTAQLVLFDANREEEACPANLETREGRVARRSAETPRAAALNASPRAPPPPQPPSRSSSFRFRLRSGSFVKDERPDRDGRRRRESASGRDDARASDARKLRQSFSVSGAERNWSPPPRPEGGAWRANSRESPDVSALN
ncbi:hypothetical protein BESB_062440 [Besnoitia besnoiti]|uniref:C2 NT-type domain-containing protein n=1 Tax=Besnoitia besnoiti TaxID=94643 RepID=A0A2A9MIE8_BESBE|nr:hypothetical protein BESB_062440 [Besnoitia besnoiti]PFH35357.1 hypothetical protein BESB_062440 [Besnoitia besnoiti]